MQFQISKARPTHTYVASVNGWQREFQSQEEADTWAEDVRARFLWAQEVGLLKLVNSGDQRWGRQGFEHLGYERDPTAKITRLTYRRISNYVGHWMTMRNWPAMKDYEWPLDLTGLLRDKRRWHRAPCPKKAAEMAPNWIIPCDWVVGTDGYYYAKGPGALFSADEKCWEPVITVQENLL